MAVQSTFYSITKKTFDCIIYIIFNPKNQNISGAMVRQLGIFVKNQGCTQFEDIKYEYIAQNLLVN